MSILGDSRARAQETIEAADRLQSDVGLVAQARSSLAIADQLYIANLMTFLQWSSSSNREPSDGERDLTEAIIVALNVRDL